MPLNRLARFLHRLFFGLLARGRDMMDEATVEAPRWLARLAIAVAGLVMAAAVAAAPVHVTFSGMVTDSDVAGVAAGDSVSGEFSYDDSAPPCGGPLCVYGPFPAFSVNAGGFSWSEPFILFLSKGAVSDQQSPSSSIVVDGDPDIVRGVVLFFLAPSDTVLGGTALADINWDLAAWPAPIDVTYTEHLVFDDGTSELVSRWDGTLTALSTSAVPEPAAIALLGAALAGLAFARRRKLG